MTQNLEVIIYKPAKSPMQSGVRKSSKWLMKFTENPGKYIFDLMNWEGGMDTTKTISIEFDSKESAIAFATKQGFKYSISESGERKIKPKSYASNFT